jgi:hypothetical protein
VTSWGRKQSVLFTCVRLIVSSFPPSSVVDVANETRGQTGGFRSPRSFQVGHAKPAIHRRMGFPSTPKLWVPLVLILRSNSLLTSVVTVISWCRFRCWCVVWVVLLGRRNATQSSEILQEWHITRIPSEQAFTCGPLSAGHSSRHQLEIFPATRPALLEAWCGGELCSRPCALAFFLSWVG